MLDVGPFAKALQYATSIEPVVIGKPSHEYFASALGRLGALADEVHVRHWHQLR